MASTILYKTAIMLILISVGILCAKTKLISAASNKDLSKFVLQVVNPVVIFMSYQTDYRTELVRNLLLTFVISLGVMTAAILLSYVFVREKEKTENRRNPLAFGRFMRYSIAWFRRRCGVFSEKNGTPR